MGWLDLGRALAARRDNPRGLGNGRVHFASQEIDLSVAVSRKAIGKPSERQNQAWAAYESIGEIGYVVDFFANCARRISLYPAVDTDEGVVNADDSDLPDALIERVRDEIDRITGTDGGLGEVLAEMAVMFKVPGEGFLVAREADDGSEVWEVYSRDALAVRDGAVWIKSTPHDRGTRLDPDTSFLTRFWRGSSRWRGVPFSELMRILGEAESLQLIAKSMNSASMSRIAGAGVLFVDEAASIPSASPDEDWIDDMIRAASTPITEPGSVAAFVPYVATVDTSGGERSVSDLVHHQSFARDLTEIEQNREALLIKRLAYGLDAPAELVTGFADVNHWTGWLVSDQTYQAHVEPLMGRIADVIAARVVRKALRSEGRWPADMIARVKVGVGADELVARPDPTKDAIEAHERLVISDATLRRRLDFDDDDAPDDEELLRRMAMKRGVTTEALTRDLLQLLTDVPVPDRAYNDRGEVIDATAEDTTAGADDTRDGPPEITAAAGVDLGEILHRIDDTLTARLQAAADAAIRRGMERAANRARTLARRTPRSELVAGVDPIRLHTIRPVLNELAIDVADLTRDADLAQLESQWEDWTTEAVVAVLLALYAAGMIGPDPLVEMGVTPPPRAGTVPDPATDTQVADAVEEWSTARAAGWAILAAAVLDRLRTIVDVGPDDDTPAVGEHDPTMLIQVAPIRHATATAGGATGTVAPGGAVLTEAGTVPAGGVATGTITVRIVNEAGGELSGYTWLTGAPRQPFPPHQALGGTRFDGWSDPVLANTGGEWPGNPHWYPGDHLGCRCSAAPRFDLPPQVASTPDTED